MRRARCIAFLAAGLGLGAGSSCSLIVDLPECVSDLDCTNAQDLELVCRDHECVAPTPPSSVDCSADSDCFAVFDQSVVCGSAGVCAPLETEHCALRVRPEGVMPDQIVYLGSILPHTGTYASMGIPLENAMQLAIEDFDGTTTLPGGKRVGWVACDSRGRASDAAAAAEELAAAGIQAIVGPALSEETVGVANVTAPAGVFLISPTASARLLGQLVDLDLVWRTAGNDAVQAAGIADRIAALDPPPERVVALVKNDRYGQGLLEDLAPRLQGVLPANGLGTLLYSPIDTFPDSQSLLSEYGARVADTFELDPDVIVVLGSVEARELILFYLDAWSSADPRPPLPTFMLSSEGVSVAETIVEGVSEGFRTTLMARMEGIAHTNRDPDDYGPFAIRYEIRFPDSEAGLDAGLAYDATMVTLLALSSLSGGEGTGSQIAEAMARLSNESGTQVSFGEGLSFITTVQQTLAAGGDVDLHGVSGELDFDLESGDLRRELTGFDLEPIAGTTEPRLTARRRYELDPAPAVTGTWVDL
ncbi:MAG: ABC transporter substrate-binding protein [Myxococcales bacterium]|nr:ABC transporter substrate-binding protein [Myxococcales bacterium]MCB9714314.1 ABC transporter substrate-binding protein [Myxococcales bacterium]